MTEQMGRDETRCVWIGHASCLVRIGAVTFLTDPVFSERCSPIRFAGPKVEPSSQGDVGADHGYAACCASCFLSG